MPLFSYIVRSDNGFSPNPFHGFCTLACCKPGIRRTAHAGDWIAGLTPKNQGYKLVFAMQVDEMLHIGEYWRDKRFLKKHPDFSYPCGTLGDNIYEPLQGGKTYRQLRSRHSCHDKKFPHGHPKRYTEDEDEVSKKRDLSGKRVLISTHFAYFGTAAAKDLPEELRNAMAVGRGYRNRFSPEILAAWQAFAAKLPNGVQNQGADENCLPPTARYTECGASSCTKTIKGTRGSCKC